MLKSRQRFAYSGAFREYLGELLESPTPEDYWDVVTPKELVALIEGEMASTA